MFETAKKIIRENKLGTTLAAVNATAALPYLIVAPIGAPLAVSAAFTLGTLPLAFFTGRSFANTFTDYSLDRERVLENPSRFVLQTAKMGALAGVGMGLGYDLFYSGLVLPFAIEVVSCRLSGAELPCEGLMGGFNYGRVGLLSLTIAKLAAKGGVAAAATGFVVFLLKK